ncbi:hypothetical protein HAX54_005148, partial [Datura stramonium]|nr:hypothetical protein [Datura stramonium]
EKQHKAWREAQAQVPYSLARHRQQGSNSRRDTQRRWRIQGSEALHFWRVKEWEAQRYQRFERHDAGKVLQEKILRATLELPALRSILNCLDLKILVNSHKNRAAPLNFLSKLS